MLYLVIFILFFFTLFIFASIALDDLPSIGRSFSNIDKTIDVTIFDRTNIYLESIENHLSSLLKLSNIDNSNLIDLIVLGTHFEQTEQFEYAFQLYNLISYMLNGSIRQIDTKLIELLLFM